MKHFAFILLGTMVGLFIGYQIFGAPYGFRIPVKCLFVRCLPEALNFFDVLGIAYDVALAQVKQRIMVCGAIGGGVGLLASLIADNTNARLRKAA